MSKKEETISTQN